MAAVVIFRYKSQAKINSTRGWIPQSLLKIRRQFTFIISMHLCILAFFSEECHISSHIIIMKNKIGSTGEVTYIVLENFYVSLCADLMKYVAYDDLKKEIRSFDNFMNLFIKLYC